jgi:hypothetical protein
VLDEETFFGELMRRTHGEVLALIHGDPGSGKSHLIHWLKLRCEDALRRNELANIVPVLIQRRTGSLKDALEQMIGQLPPDFGRYLTPVQEALSRISDATARTKLAHTLSLELSPLQRADRQRPLLPKTLATLPEVCGGSTGFRDWLCREGGVIDQIIGRLTQARGDADPDAPLPQFNAREFHIDPAHTPDNTPKVLELIDEFLDDPALCEQAAELFNEVLPDSVREMTGLSGTRLRDVFDQIRADLKKQGKYLALFIEDVSVMSALDEEVFVAVEPQSRQDLCRMIAVLGATNQGWSRLPDNQKERVTHLVSVGGQMVEEWRRRPAAVAEFAARYLNTTRLSSDDVRDVAQRRREGRDVNISACDACPVKDECHATFGKVQAGEVEIGIYPFSTVAPQRLLMHLREHAAVHKNPRGLLTRILQPIVDEGFDHLESNSFPPIRKLAVSMPELPYWTGFEQRYCGGWKAEDKARLKFLAQGWVEAGDADEAASKLKPFLKSLGFRAFTREVEPTVPPTPETPTHTTYVPQPVENAKLNEILLNLGKWIEGEPLISDRDVRQLLAEFVRRSVQWDDYSYPPLDVWKSLIGDATQYQFIRIDGMHSIPVGTRFFIDFARTKETRDLIEALAQFRYAGNRSWKFPHSEVHKRRVSQWLRRNQAHLLLQLQPQGGLDSAHPVKSAIQFLSLSALTHRRVRLPQDPTELLKFILTIQDGDAPAALSKEWQQIMSDVRIKRQSIAKFLLSELNVPQGRGALGINFINPLPALQAASSFMGEPAIETLSEDYFQSFWQGRYQIFERMERYADLRGALESERAAIREAVEGVEWSLRSLGYEEDDLPGELLKFCADLADVLSAQKAADIPVPDQVFDELKTRRVFVERKDVWATAVKQAKSIADSDDPMQVMLFDPRVLVEARDSVATAVQYLSRVENLVNDMLAHIEQEGDPDTLSASILRTLESFDGHPEAVQFGEEAAEA